jgi:hypothetical protein
MEITIYNVTRKTQMDRHYEVVTCYPLHLVVQLLCTYVKCLNVCSTVITQRTEQILVQSYPLNGLFSLTNIRTQ